MDKKDVTNMTTYSAVEGIKNRFTTLLKILPNKEDILDDGSMKIITQRVQGLEDSDINNIMQHVCNHIKGTGLKAKDIERRMKHHLSDSEDWEGFNKVEESGGEIRIFVGNKVGRVSNFTLTPAYTIDVHDDDLYYVYSARIQGNPEPRIVYLTSSDFNDIKDLRSSLKPQLKGTGGYINLSMGNIADLHHKYTRLAKFSNKKQGTNLIGLERIEDEGPKYFCTPNGIYDMDGEVSQEVLYLTNGQANKSELNNLTNLKFDKDTWVDTARSFLTDIVGINEKTAMLSILGWMGALPHDYVVRKESKAGYFPHCHIVGEPGAGKSTIMTLLKQFMGHNDSSPRAFPSAFELGKLLDSSYTIPVVLDEYGKRWSLDHTNAINKILVEAFNKTRYSKGKSDQTSVYYKYKNPLLMGGQIPTNDQALLGRIVPVALYKSFHKSRHGKSALEKVRRLQSMKDKNFWVGYNIWCARHTNEEVLDVFEKYRDHSRSVVSDMRTADIYAVVMLGLYYMKKLADELGVDIGFTDEEILAVPTNIAGESGAENATENPLSLFLHDVESYYRIVGNSNLYGNHFGKGNTVMSHLPSTSGAGQYGAATKRDACVYGKEVVLIKIDDMVAALNKYFGRSKLSYNEKEIMTFVESKFRESIEDAKSDNNLVLAPKQYRTKSGMYTAFSREVLQRTYPCFTDLT